MKNDSILRIKHFSDTDDDGEEPMEADEEVENSSEIEEETKLTSSKTKVIKPRLKIEQITRKRGIIYISSIPKHMNVTLCRELFEAFGDVGRIFLQPDQKAVQDKLSKKKSGKKRVTNFTEGWVEFEKKKVAKWVSENINNTPISTKKGSVFCDISWNLKYLPRFKWIHLSERLTYERAVHKQKLQIATSKARKEANFYQNNLDRSEKLIKIKKKQQKASDLQ